MKEKPHRIAGSAQGRIIADDFSFPFGVEKIFVRLELFGIDKLSVVKDRAPMERSHYHNHLGRIEKFDRSAAPRFWIFDVR